MNRKLVGGLTGLLVIAGVLVLVLWKRSDASKQPASKARTGEIAPQIPAVSSDQKRPEPSAAPSWELDPDPEGPLQLEGQVIGPDGKGVAGATVRISSSPTRTAKTEADGTFSFDKLVARGYWVSALNDALIGGPVHYKLTGTSDPLVIPMTEGASVEVTVLDDTRKPIAGAEVRDSPEVTASTNADGKATLRPLSPGWVNVRATAQGYAPNSESLTLGSVGARGQMTITLRKGFAVSGRVIDETGKPIANAKIGTDWGNWGFNALGDDKIVSGADGRFQIPALSAGSHVLTATDGEHAPAKSAPLTITDRPIASVEITMKAGGVVAGIVTDPEGRPAPFATVRIARNSGDANLEWTGAARQATSNDKGAFELRGLARVKQRARAESDTAASKLVDTDLTDKPEIRNLKLVLDVTGAISGIVVDEKGAPVTEVQVNAFPDILGGASRDGLALGGMASATTDGGGAFVIRGVPDNQYRLWAARTNNRMGGWGEDGTVAKTGDRNVKIMLASPGQLVGKIVFEGSLQPAKLATVRVGMRGSTPAAADGTFRITDVTPGTHDLRIVGPEFAELTKRDVKVEPGKPTDVGTLTVTRGRRLVGKVVDGAGKPIPGATVRVGEILFSLEGADNVSNEIDSNGRVRSGVSDVGGEFVLTGLPTAATTAMAYHRDRGQSPAIAIPAGTEDPQPISLGLRGFGSVTGKVVVKGKPQSGVLVTLSGKDGGSQANMSKTADDGTFTFAKVPEGTHVIQAMQQKLMDLKSTSVTAQVTAGKQSSVTIDIPVGEITLTVTIKAKPGDQVDAAQVFLFEGVAAATNAKQLTDSFLKGGAKGMKIWFGKDQPMPELTELVPGNYSVCTIPITGDLMKLQPRINANMEALKVYCKAVTITPSPAKQAFVHEVPAMSPLP